MFEIAWKEITARGRIVCKRRAFKSESARETYIDQLIQKDSFYEIRLETTLQLRPARPAVVAGLTARRMCNHSQSYLDFLPTRVINVTPA